MKQLIIEGRGPVLVAESWGELTLGQAARLLSEPDAERDTFGTLAAALGPWATRELVQNLPLESAEALFDAAAFLAGPIPEFLERPAALQLRRKLGESFELVSLPIPTELRFGTFGQACDLGVSIEALRDDLPALRIRALAIYLLPGFVGGPYDTDRLAEVEAAVAELPLAVALPVSDFFLPISRRPSPSTASSFTSASLPTPSAEQASPSSARAGIVTPSPSRWRAAISSGSTMFFAVLGRK